LYILRVQSQTILRPEVDNNDQNDEIVSQSEGCLLNETNDSDSSSVVSDTTSEDSDSGKSIEAIEYCESDSILLNDNGSSTTDNTDNYCDPELAGPSHKKSNIELTVNKQNAICSGDLGKIVKLKLERHLTDHEKYMLLKKHFVPASNFKFPPRIFNGYTRHFQVAWLKRYDGLVYSVSEDGGFCKYCVLFGRYSPSKQLGALVSMPLTNFKRACEKLTKHFHSVRTGQKYHHAAVLEANEFIRVMEDKSKGIKEQVNTKRSKRIAENVSKLVPIAQTVIFCGKQGIALRGHRDDSLAIEQDPKGNHGNFLALLNF